MAPPAVPKEMKAVSLLHAFTAHMNCIKCRVKFYVRFTLVASALPTVGYVFEKLKKN